MLRTELIYAALGTGATCLATVLGAALVFFFKKELSHLTQKVFLGLCGGSDDCRIRVVAADPRHGHGPGRRRRGAAPRGWRLCVGRRFSAGTGWDCCPICMWAAVSRRACPPAGNVPP